MYKKYKALANSEQYIMLRNKYFHISVNGEWIIYAQHAQYDTGKREK